MAVQSPTPELAQDYSHPKAKPTDWSQARKVLEDAKLYWLSTVHPGGQPNVTPLIGLWLEDAWYFCTGEHERKAHNIAENPHVAVTTGCNKMTEGLDVVLEGEATRVSDSAVLQRVADAYSAKYGDDWSFVVEDGMLKGAPGHAAAEGNEAIAFKVAPKKGLGFGKNPYSQTKWQF